jgi:outer membrane protein TolC
MRAYVLSLATLLALVVSARAQAQAPTPAAPTPEEAARASAPPVSPSDAARASETETTLTPDQLAAALRDQLAELMDDGGLSARDVVRRAVESAPSIASAERAVVASEAATRLAWQGFFPILEGSFRYTRLSRITQPSFSFGGDALDPTLAQPIVDGLEDPNARILWNGLLGAFGGEDSGFTFPVILNNYAFRISATYPISDLLFTILPGYRASQAAESAQRAQIAVEQRTIALRASEAYYALARARGGLVVANKAVEQVTAHRTQVAALVDAGAAARVDLMRVDAELARARVGAARTQGSAAIAERALQVLLHTPGEPVRLAEDFAAPLPSLDGDLETLTRNALRDRPEMVAMREAVRARESAIRVELGRRYPQLALQGNVDIANPNNRIIPQQEEFRTTWDVSVVLRWSPNEMGQARQRIEQARAQILALEADMLALEDAVRLEVAQAHEELRSSLLAFEAAVVGLAAADESYRVRREQLAAGAAVTADVIDAESELTRARLDVVDAGIAVRLAKARLDLSIAAN